jgi:intracellular multiplication protein IcmJ
MPALLPLHLMAKRGNWQQFMARKSNKSFLAMQQRVLERDQNACRYCGFKSDRFMSVVNLDHNYQNNALPNLVTACSLCMPCLFLDGIGTDGKTGGILIIEETVSQTDLNHFCRALFCSMLRDAAYRGKLQSTYIGLQERKQAVEKLFGPQTSNPNIFGQTLIDSGITPEQLLKHPVMSTLRLLPLRKYFLDESAYWRQTTFAVVPI